MNKYCFRTLFEMPIKLDDSEDVISKIEIPRIQRDYAQGRCIKTDGVSSFNEKGRRFVENIFKKLKSNSLMELDFIYGAIQRYNEGNQEKYKLLPLDGQQRLTTLFLLHWYVGRREGVVGISEMLKKFSYETRASSRQFCKLLNETGDIDFDAADISSQIKDFSWFSNSYQLDPTIQAMLNMLDEIHKSYGAVKLSLFENLDKLQFCVLPLDSFSLTDELYIKMNARGKPLTDFENFKADIISWIKKQNIEGESNYKSRTMPFYLAFSNKIDNDWTQALWRYLSQKESGKRDNKLVDPLFVSLFYRWFLLEYIFAADMSRKEIDKERDFEFIANELPFVDLQPFKLTKDNVRRVDRVFDNFFGNLDTILTAAVPSWAKKDGATSAAFLLEKGITQPQRVVLYAICAYLDKNQFDSGKFTQWMRVIWNLVENTDIDSWRSMIGVLDLVKELSSCSDDIYSKFPITLSSQSSKNAVEEERRKIDLIKADNHWEDVFVMAEQHSFLKGSVGFMMSDGMTQEEFVHRTQMAEKVFDAKGVNADFRSDHLLLRAVISQYKSFEQLENRCYVDIDEKEHYLKKMLASDSVVKDALREWLSLSNINELRKKLSEAVSVQSQMKNDKNAFCAKMHEDLYMTAGLQNWMQEKKAIRFGFNRDSWFVSRPKSWYDWVALDSYRNEMANALIEGYGCQSADIIEGTGYFHNRDISLIRMVTIDGRSCEYIYTFKADGELIVGKKTNAPRNMQSSGDITIAGNSECDNIPLRQPNYKEVKKREDVIPFLADIEKEVNLHQETNGEIEKEETGVADS